MKTEENVPTKESSCLELFDVFTQYLKKVKQLSDETILRRIPYLKRLFIGLKITSASNFPKQLTADSLTAFILDYGQIHGHGSFSAMSSCARSFLKYCHLYQILDRDYSCLIPAVYHWQLAKVPKAVSDVQISQLLDSINGSRTIDLRDKALITMLAVYGVRGIHLRKLCLNDLDWEHGIIHFSAVKGGPPIDQVITTDTGNYLSEYLLKARPQSSFTEVFLTLGHSVHPMNDSRTLSEMTSRRFKSAGIKLGVGVSYGTHGFRHAFATRLVGHIPFFDLSKMLGHRAINSTLFYSKVAFSMLREATIPWPEEVLK